MRRRIPAIVLFLYVFRCCCCCSVQSPIFNLKVRWFSLWNGGIAAREVVLLYMVRSYLQLEERVDFAQIFKSGKLHDSQMPLREGGGRKLTSILIWFKSKWGVLPVKDGPWCWVQGIDISWVGVWNSQVRVEDNSTDRTFTLNQTIRIRLKSNFHFRFKSEPDKLKITRQFLCSLLKLWTLHAKATARPQLCRSSSCLRRHRWRRLNPTQRSRTNHVEVAQSTHGSLSRSLVTGKFLVQCLGKLLSQGFLSPIHWRRGQGWNKVLMTEL